MQPTDFIDVVFGRNGLCRGSLGPATPRILHTSPSWLHIQSVSVEPILSFHAALAQVRTSQQGQSQIRLPCGHDQQLPPARDSGYDLLFRSTENCTESARSTSLPTTGTQGASPLLQINQGNQMTKEKEILIEQTKQTAIKLENSLTSLIGSVGQISIGSKEHFPYGWRKAAKGRTVWRIVEEIINQNLDKNHKSLAIDKFAPATSEVGVYDFTIKLLGDAEEVFVNIKSSVIGAKSSKDDISKAIRLLEFYEEKPAAQLFIATFVISFSEDPISVEIMKVHVMPTAWLPDIYVNPSNNGNLQSSQYKDIKKSTPRVNIEFIEELKKAVNLANAKKKGKN